MSASAIRTLAVLGGGITGLSAATAFARALPQLAVTVIETPPDPGALADRLPGTTTAVHRFHAAIGLDERALIRSGAALPRLAIRFAGWPSEPWFHVHGDHGVPTGTIPFHHLWARARREGRGDAYHRYAAAAVLAEAGRFVHPQGDPSSPLSTYDYGLRIDPPAYRAALAGLADRLGVTRTPGIFGSVERRADRHIAALLLADGRRIGADLYIDASGPAAQLLAGGFEDWRESLPLHQVTITEQAAGEAGPCDTIDALADGWQWRAPLRDKTITGMVTSSPAPGAVTIRPGRRTEPWQGNVLALGDAAVALDPLHWLPLHLVHTGIARALDLIPGRDCAPVETAEYNRRAAEEHARARDFAALYYLRAPWPSGAVPESLARTLQQFEARGRLPSYDEDSLSKEYWLAALIGLGVLPRETDPLAAAVDPDASAARMAQIAQALGRIPPQLPSYADYLAQA